MQLWVDNWRGLPLTSRQASQPQCCVVTAVVQIG